MRGGLIRGGYLSLLAAICVAAVAVPRIGEAGLFPNLFDNCCRHQSRCISAPICRTCGQCQQHCPCQATMPIVETRYRQIPQVSYQDVVQTQYRQEAFLENVPVTAYRKITVDEGSYQRIWVPKIVAKQVPYTTQQQRIGYRSVPYQVTRRIPQVSTRLVPEQTVRYATQQHQAAFHTGCNTCASTATAWPTVSATAPATGIYSRSAPTQVSVQSAPAAYGDWTTVEPKRAGSQQTTANARLGRYQIAPPPWPSSSGAGNRKTGRVRPTPSAASVWQTRRQGIRR